jgi:hypothetical protein
VRYSRLRFEHRITRFRDLKGDCKWRYGEYVRSLVH